jgi:cyclopropane-fatty-acyl-phospholipid synthase
MTLEPHQETQQKARDNHIIKRLSRSLIFRLLDKMDYGGITHIDSGERRDFGSVSNKEMSCEVSIHSSSFYRKLAFGGLLGAADSYIQGDWSCDDLVKLMQIVLRNPVLAESVGGRAGRFLRPLASIKHLLNRNTQSGSRRNIASHYDLGNEFFSLWLDETMAYSSGIFPNNKSSLYEASMAKFDRICRKLALKKSDHLLEIGTGWGGFALYAAEFYGCQVTTTTISQKQYEHVLRLVEERELTDRITVLCEDYRALTGKFDKLVSIEMVEAVGHQYFDEYFRVCSDRLENHGSMLLQSIIVHEHRYAKYLRSVDFIQHFIFPGGSVPSVGAICRSLGRSTDFRIAHLEDLTPHYAETLARWRERFSEKLEQIQKLGFSDEFIRTWEFYFAYCEGGFRERVVGDIHLLLTKSGCRQSPFLSDLSSQPTSGLEADRTHA